MNSYPTHVSPKAPPIKSQGIKTKLVPFILRTIKWDGIGNWIEPFLGSGAVLFNAQPQNAIVSDTNKHLIEIYQSIQSGAITPHILKMFLEKEGAQLEEHGESHYYKIRERFNESGQPLDFIFLNRACFNGMIRFNSKGGFNVPFCRKPERFRQGYITKICNQIAWVSKVMEGKNWTFKVQDWRESLKLAGPQDFVYLDPPYIGRHADYFNSWGIKEADELAETIKALNCGFAYSMWKENDFRVNNHLTAHFSKFPCYVFEHFYHVGASEKLRNKMQEALIISPKSVVPLDWDLVKDPIKQPDFFSMLETL